MTIHRIINGILWRLEKLCAGPRLRLFKTLYINFRTLPFCQAIKFPLFIYGHVKFYNLSGQIEIKDSIKRGMIKFGYRQGDFSGPKRCAMLLLAPGTKLIFHGPCMFDHDYAIRITGHGMVDIGAYIGFGSDTKIYCEESITIGDYCRIPFGSCFMDTNYHYSINTIDGTVHRKSAPISIGRYNWIGNTSTIMKGTRTPNGSIIASKSFLNKDYTKLSDSEPYIVLAGSPAKIVQHHATRVLSLEVEQHLNRWFDANPTEKTYSDVHLLERYTDTSGYNKLFK